jgi:hypothetical protein
MLLWIDLSGDRAVSGNIEKKGHGILKNWKFRFMDFEPRSMRLRYFDSHEADASKLKGEGIVIGCCDVPNRTSKRQHRFNIEVMISSGRSTLEVAAKSAEEKMRWMGALANGPARWKGLLGALCVADSCRCPAILLTSDWYNLALLKDVAKGFEEHSIGKGADDTPEPPEYRAGVLHEEFKLHAIGAQAANILELVGAATLESALRTALVRPIAGLYTDDDGGVLVRVNISDVAYLHELRDRVLTGALEKALQALLEHEGKLDKCWAVKTDFTQFAERYESSILQLEHLTPHQQDKIQVCMDFQNDVHIKAPAGAGKTFVALHVMLELLKNDSGAQVLFVSRNKALPCFVAAWVAKRLVGASTRDDVLQRIRLLFHPFASGPHGVQLEGGRLELVSPCMLAPANDRHQFHLVVVDEAHHVYGGGDEMRRQVEAFVTAGKTRRLLLSDVSQASDSTVGEHYPPGMVEVMLTEVVRSSRRIVAGAMAFQTGAMEALMQCHHESAGPPLKSFLFRVSQEDASRRHMLYADQVVQGILHIMSQFPGLQMHQRLAILVPDSAFLIIFTEQLRQALGAQQQTADWKLVDAEHSFSAGIIPTPPGSTTDIVLDSVSNFDGLERLIVIAVGLDSSIDAASEALETRSRLYRAISRAHMMVVVVNELLQGGWLEWLTRVKLGDSGNGVAFDKQAELERLKVKEVRRVEEKAAAAAAADAEYHAFAVSPGISPEFDPQTGAPVNADAQHLSVLRRRAGNPHQVRNLPFAEVAKPAALVDLAALVEQAEFDPDTCAPTNAAARQLRQIDCPNLPQGASANAQQPKSVDPVVQSIWDTASNEHPGYGGELAFMPMQTAEELAAVADKKDRFAAADAHSTRLLHRYLGGGDRANGGTFASWLQSEAAQEATALSGLRGFDPEFNQLTGTPVNGDAQRLAVLQWRCSSGTASGEVRKVPFSEMLTATGSFSELYVIRHGSFESLVYEGLLYGHRIAAKVFADPVDGQFADEQFPVEHGTVHFEKELQMLSAFGHPNICSLYAFSTDGPQRTLALEFCSGGCLDTRLAGESARPLLAWQARMRIAAGVARALAHLHSRQPPVLHRDVRTANVLLDGADEPKVTGLGAASFAGIGPGRRGAEPATTRRHGYVSASA